MIFNTFQKHNNNYYNYNTFKGNDASKYGEESETVALKEAGKLLGLHIEPCGLYIDEKYPFKPRLFDT